MSAVRVPETFERDGVVIRRAEPEDTRELARFYGSVPMRADLSFRMERGADLTDLLRLEADTWEVWLSERDGKVTGCASILAREGYLQGQQVTVGHLGDLRAVSRSGAALLLDAAYGPVLRSFRERTGAVAFGTAVIDSNEAALRTLVRPGAPGRPQYTPLLGYDIRSVHLTARLPVPTLRRRERSSGVQVRPMVPADVPQVAALLDREARRHSFGVPMTSERLAENLSTWPGLSVGSFLLAERCGELVGVLGIWDPGPVKRMVVEGYYNSMRQVKRVSDVLFPLVGAQPLPAPGDALSILYATHQAIAADDPLVLSALVDGAYRVWRRRGYHAITFGVPRSSPLSGAFKGLHVSNLPATFHAVTLPGEELVEGLSGQVPAFEIAMV